jgi:phytoene dehydrogenase-like protein
LASPGTKRPGFCSVRCADLPDFRPKTLVHQEFASPRSFQRYTRRTLGAVGGPPVSRRNSNFLAVGSDVFGPGIWVVGDSVFPGQGTMAAVLSAIRVVERITGKTWDSLRADA